MLVFGKSFSAGGIVLVDTSSMTAEEIAQMRTETLERTKAKIDYCLENLGKKFSEVDLKKVGELGLYSDVGVITYGLIADKYEMVYRDSNKAADYYYLEWKYSKDLPDGEYDPGGNALGLWQDAGQYKKAAKYWQEYFDAWVNRFDGKTYEESLASLNRLRVSDPDVTRDYESIMKQWNEVKLLTKTEKTKPLEPAVQNHEWFYSGKQKDVLKALDYYYQNKVKFMVDKAAKHKNPVIVDKAKEYLKSWDAQSSESTK